MGPPPGPPNNNKKHADQDESLRLWNIHTSTCIAIFAGDRGHRDEVLSADFHLLGNCFASAGMDNTVKIWALDTPRIQRAVAASYTQPHKVGPRRFRVLNPRRRTCAAQQQP